MRELWWMIGGAIRLELTGADVEKTLRELAVRCRLEQIDGITPLVVRFTIPRRAWKDVQETAERNGDSLKVLSVWGWQRMLRAWLDAPVILGTVVILLMLSVWIPSRILFIRIEGNETIADRLILEKAEESGLAFGVSREGIRSEQIKNRLLEVMPELSWVGVNTAGCVATVTVRERQLSPAQEEPVPGSIVAVTDAVIRELTVTAGSPVVQVGDAVKAGQVLISGYTDLGLCTHVEAAQGEIYGLTRRESSAVVPENTLMSGQNGVTVKKYSLLIGKNRIKFDSDSGILYVGCGKMTQIKVLRLPGGFALPVALVVEEYTLCALNEAPRDARDARQALEQISLGQVQAQMIAGQILNPEWTFHSGDGVYRLTGKLECREMIGRRSSGILTEGDANDDGENGERGAG